MVYKVETCLTCKKEFRDHGGSLGYTMREHFRAMHPEEFALVVGFEKQVSDIKKKAGVLTKTYAKNGYFRLMV